MVKKLNERQARQSLFPSEPEKNIVHVPGRQMVQLNLLSKQPDKIIIIKKGTLLPWNSQMETWKIVNRHPGQLTSKMAKSSRVRQQNRVNCHPFTLTLCSATSLILELLKYLNLTSKVV